MKPVYQTIFGGDKGVRGNCFAACIASILELLLESVPNFCAKANWREDVDIWLADRNLFYLDCKLPGDLRDELSRFWGYHIISGDGPRGFRHSVVGYAGKMVFDPHPDNTGLTDTDPEYGFLITKEFKCQTP